MKNLKFLLGAAILLLIILPGLWQQFEGFKIFLITSVSLFVIAFALQYLLLLDGRKKGSPIKKILKVPGNLSCPQCGKIYDSSWTQCLACNVPLAAPKNNTLTEEDIVAQCKWEQKVKEDYQTQEDNDREKIRKRLDALNVKYLSSFSARELDHLRRIALYVDFVNKENTRTALDSEKRNNIIWMIRANAKLSQLILSYRSWSYRKGTTGFYQVNGLIEDFLARKV